MEHDFSYQNCIHTKVAIEPQDLIISPSLHYELELFQNQVYTYRLNYIIYSIKDVKTQQKIKNHKEFLKLKYELVFDW